MLNLAIDWIGVLVIYFYILYTLVILNKQEKIEEKTNLKSSPPILKGKIK